MRCFILGATGKTGTQLVELALSQGDQVTAFVRSPQKLTPAHGLNLVQGSPADVDLMAQAMRGHDAVFSALAPGIGEILTRPSKRAWTMAGYARNIILAMDQVGVRRLLAFSSAGLFPGQSSFVRLLSFPARHHMADLSAMEGVIKQSGLHWSIARPTWMSKGSETAYRAKANAMPAAPKPLHFRGLARFMLDAATQGSHLQEIVGLAR